MRPFPLFAHPVASPTVRSSHKPSDAAADSAASDAAPRRVLPRAPATPVKHRITKHEEADRVRVTNLLAGAGGTCRHRDGGEKADGLIDPSDPQYGKTDGQPGIGCRRVPHPVAGNPAP